FENIFPRFWSGISFYVLCPPNVSVLTSLGLYPFTFAKKSARGTCPRAKFLLVAVRSVVIQVLAGAAEPTLSSKQMLGGLLARVDAGEDRVVRAVVVVVSRSPAKESAHV